MPGNNSTLDTTHYETYETRELGTFVHDSEVWDERLTYSDGSVCYGRSHAIKQKEPKRSTVSLGSVLGVMFLILLLIAAAWLFMAPL